MCAESIEPCCFLGWVSHLVAAHRDELLRLCRREGLAAEDAFDAVQEAFQTFLTLPEARPLVSDAEASKKLLVTVARNVARNRRRRHAVARPHLSGDELLEAIEGTEAPAPLLLERAEDRLKVQGCVQELAELSRAVVTMRMLDERPGEDVAEILGLSPGHVAVLLHRAKRQLKSCILDEGDTGEESWRASM